jgi:hypothetical protein
MRTRNMPNDVMSCRPARRGLRAQTCTQSIRHASNGQRASLSCQVQGEGCAATRDCRAICGPPVNSISNSWSVHCLETGSSLVLQNETIERVLLGLALVSPIGGYRGVFVFSELSAESASRTNTPKVLLRATPIFWRHLFNYVACTPIA